MSNVGDTRLVEDFQDCPNAIQVICTKKQVLKERGWFIRAATLGLLDLFGSIYYWEDVLGTRDCPSCPTGSEPLGKHYRFCCFKNAIVRIWGRAAGPGAIGEVVGDVLELGGGLPVAMGGSFFDMLRQTPTMTVPILAGIQTECMVLNGEEARLMLEAMEKALEIMQATGLYQNLIPDQETAIACLKSKMRILGW